MKQILIILTIALTPILAYAHNPLSATYYLEASKGVSVLNIYLAQAGLNQALIQIHGKENIDKMHIDDYKQEVVTYVKNNFQLSIDGDSMVVGKGGVKLGSHQTDLKFIMPEVASNAENLEVTIPAFSENSGHQTVFSFLIYGQKGKVILGKQNDYSLKMSISDTPVQELKSSIGFMTMSSMIGMGTVLVFGFYSFLKKLS